MTISRRLGRQDLLRVARVRSLRFLLVVATTCALVSGAAAQPPPVVTKSAAPRVQPTQVQSTQLQATQLQATQVQQRRMPALIDSTEGGARRILARLRIAPAIVYRDTPLARQDGRVFSQKPAPGAALSRATTTVSLGVYRHVPAQQVTVPDVVGEPLLPALRTIQGAGLVPDVARQAIRSTASAIVGAQRPPGGTRVAAGDTVALIVDITTQVPWLIGQDPATASQLLARRGLGIAVRGSAFSDAIDAGRIMRQHPDSGTPARPGEAVDVWTSLGTHPPQPELRMPMLLGLTISEAVLALRPFDLVIAHVDSVIDPSRVDRIVAQRPPRDAPIHPLDAVEVQLAVVPSERRVPWVVGLQLAEATQVMQDAGFDVRVRVAAAADGRQGVVLQQTVDSGLTRPAGTIVGVIASDTSARSLPPTRLMPDVMRLTREGAIESLGFLSPVVTVVEVETGAADENDRVIAQAPPAGTVVLPPLDVVLRIGRYAPLLPPTDQLANDSATVPALIGLTIVEARRRLAAVNLTLGDVSATDVGVDSVVANQLPGSGTVVAARSVVALSLQPRTPGSDVPWWLILVAGATIGALIVWLLVRQAPKPSKESDNEPATSPAIAVVLRPSSLDSPSVQLPEHESVVAHEVALVDRAPEITVEFPGNLIAREEVSDEHNRR